MSAQTSTDRIEQVEQDPAKCPSDVKRQIVRKAFTSTFGDTIKVLAGKEKVSFTVHQDLICQNSSFFKAACSKEWQDADEKVRPLPEHEPKIFRIYLQRLYDSTRSLRKTIKQVRSSANWDCDSEASHHCDPLLDEAHPLYFGLRLRMLGDYLGDVLFVNEAMDAMLQACPASGRQVEETIVNHIMDNTSADSGLRRWLVDHLVATLTTDDETLVDQLPDELMRAVLKGRLPKGVKSTRNEGASTAKRCKYHDHPVEVERLAQRAKDTS